MAKSVLNSLNCEICEQVCKSTEGLSRHIKAKHGMSSLDYTKKILLKEIIPLCECGCGKEVKVYPYKVNECFKGHSGGGNWQTKYDRDSEEYKTAVSKVSKSVGLYLKENPKIVSQETRERQSKYMKELLSNPDERNRRSVKMVETKILQSKDGTLSKNHYVNNRTKEDIDDIYNRIAYKASKTKIERFASGELVSWNRGKDRVTDKRIEKRAGENHYRFNPNKEVVYNKTFYDKEYRSILRGQQDDKCFKCKRYNILLCLHHVDEDKKNDSFENLIFVCRSCHTTIHNNKDLQNEFDKEVRIFKHNIILQNI